MGVLQSRRMGGAKRYPSMPVHVAMGIAALHPSYADYANAPPRSRGMFRPRFSKTTSPQNQEGAGNAGCLLHPRSRVQKCAQKAHTSIQVQSEQSGIPCAMVLRLIPRSPRRRIRLVTVAGGLMVSRARSGFAKTSADLTPATGARTTRLCRPHPVFANRLRRAFEQAAEVLSKARTAPSSGARSSLMSKLTLRKHLRPALPRPPPPAPYVRDDRDTPLLWARDGEF